jgi:hypothetical protein
MRKQCGATLMAMLAVLIMGAAWFTVTAISNPIDRTAQERTHNAAILQEAKTALVGYVAHHAAMAAENDPGALPCPEAAGNIGTALEGIAAGNCTLPAVGRLPWRTLGLDKWRDAAGEPLWYVVSAGWGKPNAATNTVINSNSTGQMTLDGTGDVVALIIAPGRPLQVSASPSCVARVQRRSAPSPAIDFRDYLECDNATMPADAIFASTGATDSFNDQVLSVTGAEALPAIEAAVADRFERQFGPQLRTAYSTGLWPATPALPFAVPFGDPAVNPTNRFLGAAGVTQGLLPVNYGFAGPCTCGPTPCICAPDQCNAGADTRCNPTFVTWSAAATTITRTGGANLDSYSCVVGAGPPTVLRCTLNVYFGLLELLAGTTWMTFNLDAVATNAGMALRMVNDPDSGMAPEITGIDTTGINPAFANSPFYYRVTGAALNNNGSATIRVNARLPAGGGTILGILGGLTCSLFGIPLCYQHTVEVPLALLSDHPMVDPANSTYNWFFRNNWHQVSYYAVAPDIAPSGPRACGANCLTVSFNNPAAGQRGLLAIAGRGLAGQARPPVALTDWLEDTNNDANLVFAVRAPTLMVNRSFNDRLIVIDP